MCMLALSASDVDRDVRCATRVADIIPYEHPSIVRIRFNHSTEPLTIFCLFDSGALKNNYASERFAAILGTFYAEDRIHGIRTRVFTSYVYLHRR
jgi:hypothetical protein